MSAAQNETRVNKSKPKGDQYTPTTDQIRKAWIAIQLGKPEASYEFDRWLDDVKAKVWSEGREAEETAWMHAFDGHPVEEGEMCDECEVENPYQSEEESGG